MSGGKNREPVKVVIIDTHFVETDAENFKSVVQELTGKYSTVADVLPPKKRVSGGRDGESVLLRDLSFKELERLLMEMPSLDDQLYQLWAT